MRDYLGDAEMAVLVGGARASERLVELGRQIAHLGSEPRYVTCQGLAEERSIILSPTQGRTSRRSILTRNSLARTLWPDGCCSPVPMTIPRG